MSLHGREKPARRGEKRGRSTAPLITAVAVAALAALLLFAPGALAAWPTPQKVSTGTTTNNDAPQIALDSAGNPNVVWFGNDGTTSQVYYAENTGSGWTPQKVSTGTTTNNLAPQIALDSGGNLSVVWHGYDASAYQVYYSAPIAPTVTTTAPSNITSTTADSGGNVTSDGGDPVTARGVCWSTSANPTISDSHTSDGTGTGTYTSSITGLDPGTTYHVRAYATNGVGTSYGADLEFTTPNPLPAITSIDPSSKNEGEVVFTLTVNGTNFVPGSVVRWNGANRTTTNVSPTKLTASIPASDIASAGTANVNVFNPAPGGGTSNAKTFTVNAPPPTTTTWYLAEGTNAWGFSTYITIENPQKEQLTARLTYMDPNPASGAGVVGTRTITLPPLSQTTISSMSDIGPVDFSTKVECLQGKPIAVDRTMFWTGEGAASPEGHSSIGTTTPSKTWYLPEGSSNWGFETWTLIQNPNAADAHVKLTYMTETGTPQVFDKTVSAHCRATPWLQTWGQRTPLPR